MPVFAVDLKLEWVQEVVWRRVGAPALVMAQAAACPQPKRQPVRIVGPDGGRRHLWSTVAAEDVAGKRQEITIPDAWWLNVMRAMSPFTIQRSYRPIKSAA